MDGWGALTMLIKRQQSDQWRKTKIRESFKEKRLDYLDKHKNVLDFPELSAIELKKIKDEIRTEIRKQKKREFFVSVIVMMILVVIGGLIYYAITNNISF